MRRTQAERARATRVLITGATGAIGRALARALYDDGAELFLTGRSRARLEELARLGERVHVFAADLQDLAAVDALFAWLDERARVLDVLVHNAAAPVTGAHVGELTSEEIRAALAVGPEAALHLVKRAERRMGEGGRIVLTSSGAGHRGVPGLAAYCAAKFALEGVARAAALELWPRGIAVNTVSLPTVDSALSRGFFSDDELAHALAPDDVLDAFRFLLSPRAAALSGRTVVEGEEYLTKASAPPLLRKSPSPLVPFLPRSREQHQREGMRPPIAKVDLGEPAFPPSPSVIATVDEWMRSPHPQDYPDAKHERLRAALAERHGLTPEYILPSPGSSALLGWLLDHLVTREGQVVAPSPCFVLWPWLAQSRALDVVEVATTTPHHDTDAMLAAVGPRTELVYFDSPNNPLGAVLRKRDFERFLRELPRHVFVVVDHAYRDFCTDAEALDATTAEVLYDPRVLSVRTLSKSHALAGWRVGYLAAHPQTVRALMGAVPPFSLSAPAERAAVAALDDEEHTARLFDHFARERRRIWARLDELGVPYAPAETSFISIPWPNVSSVVVHAAARGIALAPCDTDDRLLFGMRTEDDDTRVLDLIERFHPASKRRSLPPS